jgi:hypothetical protein
MSENKLQANGFVKTPESWEELTLLQPIWDGTWPANTTMKS